MIQKESCNHIASAGTSKKVQNCLCYFVMSLLVQMFPAITWTWFITFTKRSFGCLVWFYSLIKSSGYQRLSLEWVMVLQNLSDECRQQVWMGMCKLDQVCASFKWLKLEKKCRFWIKKYTKRDNGSIQEVEFKYIEHVKRTRDSV